MTRTLTTWLIVTLAGMALVAGCGGGSTSSTQTVTSSSTGAATSGGATGAAGTGPGATGSTVSQKQQGAIAVSSCKKAIHAETSISASSKAKLEGICEKAAGGSKQELEKVAHEECVALVEATPLPNGASKQRALAICRAPA